MIATRRTPVPPAALVRMRRVATGLLLAMAALFLAARALADREGWSEDRYLQALNDTLAELKARKGQPSAAPAPAPPAPRD